MEKEWFESWFDSSYYKLLYRHRDDKEARLFIQNLINFLHPLPESHFLDLACGRGRHSRFLHSLGWQVTGYDLSPQSIKEAKKYTQEELNFYVQDMREAFPGNFDFILNLFTSFGYFERQAENLLVLQNTYNALSSKGTFVLDYFNTPKVIEGLVPEETKIIAGVHFALKRSLENGFILKEINIKDGGQNFYFQERVQAIKKLEFEEMLGSAGFEVYEYWGDYEGNAWTEESPRLILFCRKQQ